MRRILTAILVTVGLVAASVGATAVILYRRLEKFGETPYAEDKAPSVRVTVARGSTTQAIGQELEKAGVIRSARQFYLYARYFKGQDHLLRPGEYDLSASLAPAQIMARLIKGDVVTYKFTIPEGSNLKEIARIIGATRLAREDELLEFMRDADFAEAMGVPKEQGHLEGYLFPDTYRFPSGVSAKDILKVMRQRADKALTPEIMAKGKALGLSPHQVLTLASIVEKETGAAKERPLISAVFHNRLQKGMKLQTDPTVIYGIADYQGNITRKDLETPHPYNTYIIKGLPPGPIAAPGAAAIDAAVAPADVKYLFFVSQNDGTHVFCETLYCHNKNVEKWQVEFFKKGAKKG
ncbi:MAG: endolytic transglycosylase MltG [Deltaproteobacteria bacterium]|nr:endolytic transglycosylase MltG [Deltaproteobacteria bacterium]